MMEKGISFERNSQLNKLQQENNMLKAEMQKLEREIERERKIKDKIITEESGKIPVNECERCQKMGETILSLTV